MSRGEPAVRAAAAVRELRQGNGPQVRPLRPLLLLLGLPRLQDHPQDRPQVVLTAQADRRQMPDLQRRRARRAHLPPRRLLLLQPLPQVRVLTSNNRPVARVRKNHAPYSWKKETQARRPIEDCNNGECDYPRPMCGAGRANENFFMREPAPHPTLPGGERGLVYAKRRA